MASKNLTYKIFGKDMSASKTMESVGARAGRVARNVAKAAAAIAAALALVVVRFGVESVKAALDAEVAQEKLTSAWAKFPATADLSIDALREFNSTLQKTTKYDDEAIASGQAILARFKLTGTQIKKVTPLLLDYATATGKDLNTAAQDLGKALLGQGRALKAIGIDFKATGDKTKDLETLMGLLQDKVGGFAEQAGGTDAGKFQILQNRFGEFQEKIGTALLGPLTELVNFMDSTVMPKLEEFGDWFVGPGMQGLKEFKDWVVQYKDVLGPAAVAIAGLTTAQWLLNIAMAANPIGATILGITILIALFAALMTDLGGMRTKLLGFWTPFVNGILGVAVGIAMGVQTVVNSVINGIQLMLQPLNQLRSLLGMPIIMLPRATFGNAISQGANMLKQNWQGTVNGASGGSVKIGGKVPQLAAGGIVPARPGGWLVNVGEGGQDEAIVPLSKAGQFGGSTTIIKIGTLVGDSNRAMRQLERMVVRAQGRGAIPGTALGA